jgi:hypothetical protein
MIAENRQERFPLGRLAATPRALDEMQLANQNPLQLLKRHQSGDWGEVSKEDAAENELAVEQGLRLMSVYTLVTGVKVWIITDADRSVTTILLPQDY